MRLRQCVIIKYNTDPKEPEFTRQDCWIPEQCAILENYINIKNADEIWEQWKIQEVSANFKELSDESREKLLKAERQSMERSAVIDYVRAENKQLRDLLGVDDKVKDFSAGEQLRLLRVALAQSEEEIEHLKVKLEKIRQVRQ